MKLAEIAALADGLAPVIRDLMAGAVKPLADRIDELERELRARDDAETIRALVAAAVAEVPPAPAGKDADPAEMARLVDEAVARLPPAKDGEPGKDIDPEVVRQMIADQVAKLPPAEPGRDADPEIIRQVVAEAVAKIPAPKDGADADPAVVRQMIDEAVGALPMAVPGKDVDPEVVADMVRAEVERAVAGLPVPKDGVSVTAEELMPLIEERLPVIVSEAVARVPVPKDGAPGKMPAAKAWADEVHHEGDVVTHDGATYQAHRDTGKAPPHEDWICLAAAGRDGNDGRSFTVRGTYAVTNAYQALDVVALNGGAFIARKDDPGVCPGPDWQLIAAQGKAGKPGERGLPGKGERGDPGQPVVAAAVDGMGLLTLVNGDGSTVDVDLYPLLDKVAQR
jgi:hypothetical protein